MVAPDACGLFYQVNVSCFTVKMAQVMAREAQQPISDVDLASKFCRC